MTHVNGVCTHCAGPATLSLPHGAWEHDETSCWHPERPEARFLAHGETQAKPQHKRGKQ